MNKESITILGITIHATANGLYSLRDLWVAGGKKKSKQANSFLALKSTSELVGALAQNLGVLSNQGVIETVNGSSEFGGGTYACKILVYAYAMWISPDFNIAVIQAFDTLVNAKSLSELSHAQDMALKATQQQLDYVTGKLASYQNHAPDDAQTLSMIVGCSRAQSSKYFDVLVGKGELECVITYTPKKHYLPTTNSKHVVGAKKETLLFAPTVKSLLPTQTDWCE